MELNIKTDLIQTLGIRQMHDLMEINIKTDKKFECVFVDKKQAQEIINKLKLWVGRKSDVRQSALPISYVSGLLANCPNCGQELQLEVKEMTNSDIIKALQDNNR